MYPSENAVNTATDVESAEAGKRLHEWARFFADLRSIAIPWETFFGIQKLELMPTFNRPVVFGNSCLLPV